MIQRTGKLMLRFIPDFSSSQPEKASPAHHHYFLCPSRRLWGLMKALFYFSICYAIIFVPLMKAISTPQSFMVKNERLQARF
jgi:hypothetical protein